MTIALIDMQDAKSHLRVTSPDADDDIALKIEAASTLVLQVLKLAAVPAAWFVGSPAVIEAPEYEKQLTRLFLAELYFNREAGISNLFSEQMMNMIRLKREPTVG